MTIRGIRGAVTVDNNTVEDIKSSVIQLISEIKKNNNFNYDDVSYVIFTMTDDLDCIYPAKTAREEFEEFKFIPMMCTQELKINNSLKKCLRILIVINTNLSQKEIKHIYLKGAKELREDLK